VVLEDCNDGAGSVLLVGWCGLMWLEGWWRRGAGGSMVLDDRGTGRELLERGCGNGAAATVVLDGLYWKGGARTLLLERFNWMSEVVERCGLRRGAARKVAWDG
jgi:hypothetical protein